MIKTGQHIGFKQQEQGIQQQMWWIFETTHMNPTTNWQPFTGHKWSKMWMSSANFTFTSHTWEDIIGFFSVASRTSRTETCEAEANWDIEHAYLNQLMTRHSKWWFSIVTFPQSNVAMEHPPSVDDFPSSVWLPEGIPSGKLTLCELENHNVYWVNQL